MEDRVLKYRITLTENGQLTLLAHELGHVILHRHLMDPVSPSIQS